MTSEQQHVQNVLSITVIIDHLSSVPNPLRSRTTHLLRLLAPVAYLSCSCISRSHLLPQRTLHSWGLLQLCQTSYLTTTIRTRPPKFTLADNYTHYTDSSCQLPFCSQVILDYIRGWYCQNIRLASVIGPRSLAEYKPVVQSWLLVILFYYPIFIIRFHSEASQQVWYSNTPSLEVFLFRNMDTATYLAMSILLPLGQTVGSAERLPRPRWKAPVISSEVLHATIPSILCLLRNSRWHEYVQM